MTRQDSDTLRSLLEALDSALALRANTLWKIVKEIHEQQSRTPGSVNGRAHCEMVESNIWRLINETNQRDDFTALELFILSCSACCHDFDKGLEASLPEEYHGVESGNFVVKRAGELVLNDAEAYAVNLIVSIHDRKADYVTALDKLPYRFSMANETVDMRRLAVLVKVADILHTDSSRVSRLTVDPDKLTGLARKKYLARKCNFGWGVNGDRVVFNAHPSTQEEESAFRECWAFMLNEEWKPIAGELRSYALPFNLEVEMLGGPPPVGAAAPPGRPDTGNRGRDVRPPLSEKELLEELLQLFEGDVMDFLAVVVPCGFPAGTISTQTNPRVAYARFVRRLRGLDADSLSRIFSGLVKYAPGSVVLKAWAEDCRKSAGD